MVWKKPVTIASLVCAVVIICLFFIFVYGSDLPVVVKFLLYVVGIVDAAGIVIRLGSFFRHLAHERANLVSGPGGAITIEIAALRSVALKAIEGLGGCTVNKVTPKVFVKRGVPFIEYDVKLASGTGTNLTGVAAAVQNVVKAAAESLTGVEVRYVAVNYVESGSRSAKQAD